jgi:hypothetical protein
MGNEDNLPAVSAYRERNGLFLAMPTKSVEIILDFCAKKCLNKIAESCKESADR